MASRKEVVRMGGGVAMNIAIRVPERIRRLTLVDTMSPYGYTGTKDETGTPCYDDGGAAECPAQPMVKQTESVLSTYEKNGGSVERVVIDDAGGVQRSVSPFSRFGGLRGRPR